MTKDISNNYLDFNQQFWDNAVAPHVESDFYDVPRFLETKNSLNQVEMDQLGDVAGKTLLHLQCHFGMDSLSWAHKGAAVTAVDFSEVAIKQANELSLQTGIAADFIHSDIYALPKHLDQQFDVVFTSYGTIIWLPDLDRWAKVIADRLKPGGEFHIVDFHPVQQMLGEKEAKFQYPYFNTEPIVEDEEGSYANEGEKKTRTIVSWNHSFSETFDALWANGLEIVQFDEFDYSPYNCFANLVESAPGKWQVKGLQGMLPMVYGLKAIKL